MLNVKPCFVLVTLDLLNIRLGLVSDFTFKQYDLKLYPWNTADSRVWGRSLNLRAERKATSGN
jgi:hypothetical protein